MMCSITQSFLKLPKPKKAAKTNVCPPLNRPMTMECAMEELWPLKW